MVWPHPLSLQVEIDEYQNYDKALGALNESLKCFVKVKSRTPAIEAKMQFLQDRISLVGKFAEARRYCNVTNVESPQTVYIIMWSLSIHSLHNMQLKPDTAFRKDIIS